MLQGQGYGHLCREVKSLPPTFRYGAHAGMENQYHVPYSLDQTPLSISRRTSGSVERNSGRSRIVAAPRLLFENTSTWTCLATRFRWQVHDKQSRTSSNLLLHQQRGQNLLDQRYQSTVFLRIASLAATDINKRRSRIVAALE